MASSRVAGRVQARMREWEWEWEWERWQARKLGAVARLRSVAGLLVMAGGLSVATLAAAPAGTGPERQAEGPPAPAMAAPVLAAAAVQAGLDPGPAVWSADGRWWLVADRQRPRLLLFSADGRLQRDWEVASLDGRQRSRVSALQASSARRSVVVALQDLAELWEISLDPQAEPLYDGLVHDYRMSEAIAQPGYLGLRRAPLEQPLQDFRIDPTGQLVLGLPPASDTLEVIHLAVRRRIARLVLNAPPDLDRLDFGRSDGLRWLAVAPRQGGRLQCFERATWAPIVAGPCKP